MRIRGFVSTSLLLLFLYLSTITIMAATVNNEDTEWGRAMEERPLAVEDSCPHNHHHEESKEVESVEIAIIGGGLVGLAVAIGLVGKLGGDDDTVPAIKVYERAPQLRSSSQGILALQPNGMAALDTIHPNITVKARETGCERHYFRKTTIDAEGVTTEKKTNTGDEFLSKYGRRKVGISWHNMQRNLASMLNKDMIETNHSLQSYQEEEDSVLLYFENGSVVRAKVVLACDGLFSAARRQVVTDEQDHDSPIFFGQLNWGTIIKTSLLPSNLIQDNNNTVRYITHDGNPRWMSMINDGGSGYTFWQFRLADTEKAMAVSGNQGRGGLGLTGVKEKLLALVAGTCDDVASTIQAISEEQIFERSIVGRYPLKTWLSRPNGRLVLVGDAAHGMHPNIGQGANQGFLSAAAIVDMLNKYRGDYQTALTNFERYRKPRADLVQTFANAMGVLQATGQKLLSHDKMSDMMGWVLRNEDAESAPAAIVEFLGKFDPCDHVGVSKLW